MSALPEISFPDSTSSVTTAKRTSTKPGSVSNLNPKKGKKPAAPEPPAWMASAAAYWREHDFGRGGRPAPGTTLILTLAPSFGIPVGATCAKVLPYDGRWVSSTFPVRLMRPNFQPTEVSWMLSTRPARNGDTCILNTYDLVGCKLAESGDLVGTHATGRYDVETVTLRARLLQAVGSDGAA